jgi:hypothetical protein
VAILRDKSVTFGPFRLDPRTESLWCDAEEIRLRPKTFGVLRYLAERPSRLITMQELLEALWSESGRRRCRTAVCVGERSEGRCSGTMPGSPRIHRDHPSTEGYRFYWIRRGHRQRGPPQRLPLVGREARAEPTQPRVAGARVCMVSGRSVFVTGEPGSARRRSSRRSWLASPGNTTSALAARPPPPMPGPTNGAGEPYLPILEAVSRMARSPGARTDRVRSFRQHAPTWLLQIAQLGGRRGRSPRSGPGSRERRGSACYAR